MTVTRIDRLARSTFYLVGIAKRIVEPLRDNKSGAPGLRRLDG